MKSFPMVLAITKVPQFDVVEAVADVAIPVFNGDSYFMSLIIDYVMLEEHYNQLYGQEIPNRFCFIGHGDKERVALKGWNFDTILSGYFEFKFFKKQPRYKLVLFFSCFSYEILSSSNWNGCFEEWVAYTDLVTFTSNPSFKLTKNLWEKVFQAKKEGLKSASDSLTLKETIKRAYQQAKLEAYINNDLTTFKSMATNLNQLRCNSDKE